MMEAGVASWLAWGRASTQGHAKCVAFRFVTHWTTVTLRWRKAQTDFEIKKLMSYLFSEIIHGSKDDL